MNELESVAWEVTQCVISPSQLPMSIAEDDSICNSMGRLQKKQLQLCHQMKLYFDLFIAEITESANK